VKISKRPKAGNFDVWFPALAPSRNLLKRFAGKTDNSFFDAYERELLATAVSRQTITFLVQLASRMRISVGCYCKDEIICHRSRSLNTAKRGEEAEASCMRFVPPGSSRLRVAREGHNIHPVREDSQANNHR
jgi:uncharacterized protein YeaO (DUF488 family)